MAARTNCFGVPPFFRKKLLSGYEGKEQTSKSSKSSKYPKQMRGGTARGSYKMVGNFTKMNDLQNKILTFRDLLDLCPCISSASIDQIIIWTLKDLGRINANFRPSISISELQKSPLNKVLNCFCDVLKLIGDLWTNNSQWMVNCKLDAYDKLNQDDLEQKALAMLEDINRLARERMFDMMDTDETSSNYSENSFGSTFSESYLDNAKTSISSSPITPTSIIPNSSNALYDGKMLYYAQPFLSPLRFQAVEKLNPIDLKRLSFHVFSHVPAQDPDFLNQNQINEIQMLEMPVKYDSKVTEEESDEASLTFEIENDSSIITLDESENNNGGDPKNVESAKSIPDACSPTKSDTDDFKSPTSLHRLWSEVSESVTPPPEESALMSPNEVLSSLIFAPPTSNSPPLPHMFSPNKVLPQPQTEAPSSKPISQQSSDTPRNLKIPTSPPPSGTGYMIPHPPPPPPMTSSSTLVFPPPPSPPPPPPPIPMTSNSTLVFPPPPPTSSTMASTIHLPQPPPPMTLRINMSFPSPSPHPQTPIASGTITRPPPPPSALRKFAPSPPAPLSTMEKINMASPPPPPPIGTSNSGVPTPPPPRPVKMGGGPPPPLGLGANNLHPKKVVTKLKRSSHVGQLYRLVKGKMEGSCLEGKTQKKGKIGASAGGKQGMADALAEMTKRSTYFQQIEKDAKNHAKSISELKVSINSFKNSDMTELQNFHKHVESHLEKLTDETQVIARFEDFPTKKLEALRMAAALDSQLNDIFTTLNNWQIKSSVNQVLDKLENYFNKIKVQLDALERTKDEETKKFNSQNILFDFSILIRIKELMVDISSSCMELALKEGREAKAMENIQKGIKLEKKKKGFAKVLWRVFQFAYRVYIFSGGYDDRADMLTRQLAHEIETNPSN